MEDGGKGIGVGVYLGDCETLVLQTPKRYISREIADLVVERQKLQRN